MSKQYKYKAEVELVVEGEIDGDDHDDVIRKIKEKLSSDGFKNVKIKYSKTTVIKDLGDDLDDFDIDFIDYPFP